MSFYHDATVTLTVDGVRVPFETFSTLHGVKNPIGQASITLPTPLPSFMTAGNGPINRRAVLTATQASYDGIVAGKRQNLTVESGIIFTGTIRANDFSSDPSGRTRTFRCQDDLWMFGVNGYVEQAFDGPIEATTLVRNILATKGYGTSRRPPVFLDQLRFPDNSTYVLGGIDEVDDGQIILRDGSNLLQLMRNIAEVPGFAFYGLPPGSPRLSRVMGIPPAVGATDLFRADGGYRVIDSAREGFSFRGGDDADTGVNYVEVFGVSYSLEDGTGIDIRSFPASLLANPDLPSDAKVKNETFSSGFIYTQRQADGARNIRELDHGARSTSVTIEMDGKPTLYPGHVNKVIAPDLGLNQTFFVETVAHAGDSNGGYRTTVTYDRGAGSARPAGVDVCQFRTLFSGTIHLGDEYVEWYEIESPTGVEKTYTFTPTAEMTDMAFCANAHGCNSQWTAKPPPEGLSGSKVTFEQPSGTSIGSNELPILDERFTEQLDYTLPANRTAIQVPISGTLVAGTAAVVRITSGTDGVGRDDFELNNLRVMWCREGQPTLPKDPTPPTTPTPPRQEPGSTAPGGGTGTIPDRPARYSLLPDGTAKPGTTARSTAKRFTIPKGSTRLQVSVTATNLAGTTGSKGAGWSEYFEVRLSGASGASTLLGRLLNNADVVQAGSGLRTFAWDITALLAGESKDLIPETTRIVSEVNTITLDHWDALVTRGA